MHKKRAIIKVLMSDLTYNRFVFFSLMILISLINMIIFFTETTFSGFFMSIQNVRNQLGADIIIVSQQYDSDMKDALFSGKPSTFSFDKYSVEGLKEIDGIDIYTSQLFVSSLDSSCCDEKVEFVIYDESSDFIVSSLISEYQGELNKRDIVIGSNIDYQVGEHVTFFECIFNVAGKMKKTGMGYDECIFVNESGGESISSFLEMDSYSDKASMILIKKQEGYEIEKLCEDINDNVSQYGLVAYSTQNLYTDIEDNITTIMRISIGYLIQLIVLAIISIFVIMLMNTVAKAKNFTILTILGISKIKKYIILIVENLFLTFLSALLGNLGGVFLLMLFRNYISMKFQIPLTMSITTINQISQNIIISFLVISLTTTVVYKVVSTKQDKYFKRELV